MPSVAPVNPGHRSASAVLAAGGLAILLAVLVIAVVTVSDESTKPVTTSPTAVAPTPSPSATAPMPTASAAPPAATAAPRPPDPTETAATEATAPPAEPGQDDGPPWRRYWRFPRHRGGQWGGTGDQG
jgi:hypothetical protein